MSITYKNYRDKRSYQQKAQLAVDLLIKGYMCSGAILMAFSGEFDLNPEIAAKISGGFPGGMAEGKTCGAVTGAIMVIGLKYGSGLTPDQYSKDLCFQMTQEFSYRFKKRRKSLECSEILSMENIDPKNSEIIKKIRAKQLCDLVVKDSAEILGELLAED